MFVKNIIKSGKYIHIKEYKKGVRFKTDIRCRIHASHNCTLCRYTHGTISENSIYKTKQKIFDYALHNDFNYFFTLTYNPARTNSFNYDLSKSKLMNWLDRQKKLFPDLKYLYVPEYHKSGRIHFHLLIDNYYGELKDSKHTTKKGYKIYNITDWKHGHSTATKTDGNNPALATYLTKYITKDLIKQQKRKKYGKSKNLQTPLKSYNIDSTALEKAGFVEKKYEDINIRVYSSY